MCAERNAIAQMITNGESRIEKIVAVMPDGSLALPCGACRELMMQLDSKSGEIEILVDLDTRRRVLLQDLIPTGGNRSVFRRRVMGPVPCETRRTTEGRPGTPYCRGQTVKRKTRNRSRPVSCLCIFKDALNWDLLLYVLTARGRGQPLPERRYRPGRRIGGSRR